MYATNAAVQHSKRGPKIITPSVLTSLMKLSRLILILTSGMESRSTGHIGNNDRRYQSEAPNLDPARYLQMFGYLPGSDFETGALRTEEEFSRAIRDFQSFANIPATGRLDTATMAAMKKSRCGMKDHLESRGHHSNEFQMSVQGYSSASNSGTSIQHPQQYHLGPSKWQKKWLTFRLLNFTPDLSREEARSAIIRAFHLWGEVIPITFHEVHTGYADIYIQFSSGYHQDGYPFDGKGGVLAHAFFPGEEKGGDVHFDDDEEWTVYSVQGTNLFIVAAHELGHSLGLAHSNVLGSLMYPWHQGYQADFRLHHDDVSAIQAIYGSRNQTTKHNQTQKPPTDPRVNTVTVRPTTSTTTTTKPSTTSTSGRPTLTSTHAPQKPYNPAIEYCDTSVDAISIIRGEMFIFKDDKFWRINKNGLTNNLPIPVYQFWRGVPEHVTKIDAVFERPLDNRIIFISGKRYWELDGINRVYAFPENGRPISDFGLPEDLQYVDAAFVWDHNKRVYVISGDMYWRLSNTKHQVEYGYPRDMSMWGGVKLPVDAAFTDKEGMTHFFRGSHFWEFNNARMHVRHEKHPGHIAHRWLNCALQTNHTVHGNDKLTGNADVNKQVLSNSSWRSAKSSPLLLLLLLLDVCCTISSFYYYKIIYLT